MMRHHARAIAAALVLIAGPAVAQNVLVNAGFSAGLAGWTPWIQHDGNNNFAAIVTGGELGITGSDFSGGVYQQIDTGGAGMVVNVLGRWRSDPTLANALSAEVLVINADRVPLDGVNETDGVNGAVTLYRNDTFGGRGAWDDVMPRSAPLKNQASFVASGDKATIVLRVTNTATGTTAGVRFDDLQVRCVPAAAPMSSLPSGFTGRMLTFPAGQIVAIAQSPVSRSIYAVRNNDWGGATLLYRVNTGGLFSVFQVADLTASAGVNSVQGMTFDAAGNLYLSTFFGRVVKGVDTNADPSVDSFTFSEILQLPQQQIGTLHGVGGLAIGPDEMLYINSGSESHYGYLPSGLAEVFAGRLNARILRCRLDGAGLEEFCNGIRNSFDIDFRADGRLFGVENGPNTGCDYADEFNLLEQGRHYGFPYRYGSDLSGSDSSIACQNPGGGNVSGPPPLPAGITPVPAWANYGPDGKPGPGEIGEQDGIADIYGGFHPHSSPDGLTFYEPARMDPAAIKFPPEFHGRAFVARLGQAETGIPDVGFDVLSMRLDDAGSGFLCNRFLTGTGRCIGVLAAYNARLYVLEFSQDTGGAGFSGNSRLHEVSYTIATTPVIALSRTWITRTMTSGGSLSDDTFTVANGGAGTLHYSVSPDGAPWLSVSPGGGTSTGPGEAGTFTVSYEANLAPGTHTARIMITDPDAGNDPQTVLVTVIVRRLRADFDADGDVDQSDFGHLQRCLASAGDTPAPACRDADLNGLDGVTGTDFNLFAQCFAGPNKTPDPACEAGYQP